MVIADTRETKKTCPYKVEDEKGEHVFRDYALDSKGRLLCDKINCKYATGEVRSFEGELPKVRVCKVEALVDASFSL